MILETDFLNFTIDENAQNAAFFIKGKEVFWHLHYPKASMGWFGIESGGNFLYVGRHDEKARACFLTVKQKIRSDVQNLMLGVNNMPMARPSERVEMAPTVVGILEGDFRSGADTYRKWADGAFYSVPKKEKWVKELTGWQRIIMRSQYGEDYYKASDLPNVYLEGAKLWRNQVLSQLELLNTFGAVAKLFKAGIVGGDAGSGNFRPSDSIKRSEAYVIFTRIAIKSARV